MTLRKMIFENLTVEQLVQSVIALVVTLSYVIALFLQITISDYFSNAFIFVLGYYFAKSTNQKGVE